MSIESGGAGSGYIGNSLLSNKKMVGYNVPTSSAESTKTESVNEASETPIANKPKIGNGFARIKLLDDILAILKLETYGATIYGQFNIPSKNVQNKTVVAKANGVPANITDGIAFSLSSYDGNPFRMTGFSANTHYYFVIFDETPNASRPKSNIFDIVTSASVNVLMDSDSRYIDNNMLDYSIVNQSSQSQNWYHYDSNNVCYYKNNYYNSGHSYLIFNGTINTGNYKYICIDAEIIEGAIPSSSDQHWNYLAAAIVLDSDGTPICKTNVDEVTNSHKTVYMTRWDEFIPANNKDWLTTGKLPRYMIKVPINDIPNMDIRLVVFSCDAKNRVYGVLLEG